MVTKQTDFKRDFDYGEVTFLKPASSEDMKQGIDAWVSGIPFAWRKRRIPITKYGELSIRYSRSNSSKTEYEKILDGNFKPQFYVFEFTDAIVICLTSDICNCLIKRDYIVQSNPDNTTKGCYIKLESIKHLIIRRSDGRD